MTYKEKILEQIKTMTYEKALQELKYNIKKITGDWDTVVEKNGKYYLYDYSRNHGAEKYGEEVSEDDRNKYMALVEVWEQVFYTREGVMKEKRLEL